MNLELFLYIALGTVFMALALAAPLFAQRLSHRRSQRAILPLAQLRGWPELTRDRESLQPYLASAWNRLLSSETSAQGTWQGLRAEFGTTQVYLKRNATTAVVECPRLPMGLGPVSATNRNDPHYRGYQKYIGEAETLRAEPTALDQRFRLSGQERDLRVLFVPDIERAILEFPINLYSVSFYGRIASVVWIGYEKNPAIVDAALDLATSICRQVDSATTSGGS